MGRLRSSSNRMNRSQVKCLPQLCHGAAVPGAHTQDHGSVCGPGQPGQLGQPTGTAQYARLGFYFFWSHVCFLYRFWNKMANELPKYPLDRT